MKYFWIIAVLLATIGTARCDNDVSPGNDEPAKSQDIHTVTIFAASSLRETVTDVAAEFSKRFGVQCSTRFDSTSTLGKQISEGAKADVFLTAAPEWLDKVQPQQRFDWLGNRLVFVVAKDSGDVKLENLSSLSLANEQVPAGKYAKAALEHFHVKLPERIIYGESVRDVLSKVSEGGAKAGIVYATDAAIDPDVRIAFTFPPESHPKIVYSAGLLNDNGKTFYDVLRESYAMAIAKKYGFEDLKP